MKVGVHKEAERKEEQDKGYNAHVEELLPRQLVGQVGVPDGEENGTRKITVGLQEWNNLGTSSSNDKHVLGISQNGVVEENDEEHKSEREELLPLILRGNKASQTIAKRLGGG